MQSAISKPNFLSLHKILCGPREMAQQLKSVYCSCQGPKLTTTCNSISRSQCLLLAYLGTALIWTYTCIYKHIILKIKITFLNSSVIRNIREVQPLPTVCWYLTRDPGTAVNAPTQPADIISQEHPMGTHVFTSIFSMMMDTCHRAVCQTNGHPLCQGCCLDSNKANLWEQSPTAPCISPGASEHLDAYNHYSELMRDWGSQ